MSLQKRNKNILFIVKNISAFLELLELAEILKISGRYEPFFYLHRLKSNADIFLKECEKAGIEYKLGGHAKWFLLDQGKKPKKAKHFSNSFIAFLYNIYWQFRERIVLKAKHYFFIKRFLSKNEIKGVVVDSSAGSVISLNDLFVRIANKKKLPTVFYTWAILQPYNSIIKIVGKSKYILASCEFQKEIMVSAGVPAEKIIVSGKISIDKMILTEKELSKLKSDLQEKYNFNKANKLALVLIAPYGEDRLVSWKEHWRIIENMLSIITKETEIDILVSLHPRMPRGKYEFLENKFNLKILDKRYFEVLPVCDLFIASISSVLPFALMLGIPTLVYNPIPIQHAYKKNFGFIEVQNERSFQKIFKKMVNDEDFRKTVSKTASSENYFGFSDNKSGERALKFFDNLFNYDTEKEKEYFIGN